MTTTLASLLLLLLLVVLIAYLPWPTDAAQSNPHFVEAMRIRRRNGQHLANQIYWLPRWWIHRLHLRLKRLRKGHSHAA